MHAFQLIAISSGKGRFETKTRVYHISEGDVFILPPGVWHRYRPDEKTGWTEQWFELRGPALETWANEGLLDFPPVKISRAKAFWKRFAELHALCLTHPQGFRPVAAGLAMTLLAEASAASAATAKGKSEILPEIARRARGILQSGVSIKEAAHRLGVSYPTLHRHFKRATGLTPKDYTSQIRMARAEELLTGTNLSMKEIAERLGYHSASHFSLEFKRIHGFAPTNWVDRGR